jgi:uncharacterized protein YdhG (YjbR/CyaY superfamily)
MTIEIKKKFKTVDEYIASQPEQVRAGLEQFRQIIKKAAPNAEECISYQMPAFKYHGMLLWYAAFSKHYGFYVMTDAIVKFKLKLTSYELSKGTIRFPIDKPLPLKLITKIVNYRVKQNIAKQAIKDAANKTKLKNKES